MGYLVSEALSDDFQKFISQLSKIFKVEAPGADGGGANE